VTERRAPWLRLAALAAVVLAIHLWLLGGIPRLIAPVQRATPFVARTVVPTPPAAQTPAPAAVTKAPRHVAPPLSAPGKQAAPRAPAAPVAPPQAATAPQVATAASTAPASAAPPPTAPAATHVAGAAAAGHFAVPPSAKFHYDVTAQAKGFVLKGRAELEWRNENGQYEAQLEMTAPFLKPRVQRSTGLVTAQGLAPLRFSDKSRSEEAAHFDREQGKVIFSTNQPEALLEPGAQDRLSIVMQLGAMLAGNPSKYPAGSQITVQTASTKEAQPWTFTVEGSETLDLPGGRTTAVRLTRNPRKEYDVKVELWLAPGQAYAPVRLRLTQPGGDWVDQQWSSTDRA
jgi:hypothetical protein